VRIVIVNQVHDDRDANFVEFQGQGTLVAQWGDLDTAVKQGDLRPVRGRPSETPIGGGTVDAYGDVACAALMPRDRGAAARRRGCRR